MTTKYMAWSPNHGQDEEDGQKLAAAQYEGPCEIASKWAEWCDITDADYDIAGKGKTVRVLVRNLTTNEVTHWDVIGEVVPCYSAISVALPV